MIYDRAPEGLRYGIREVLQVLGFNKPSQQRSILCKALRTFPDTDYNWSEVPNIDDEVSQMLVSTIWYKYLDAIERLPIYLDRFYIGVYYKKMNALFAEEEVGYRFDSGRLVRVGSDVFHATVRAAQSALQDDRFEEPRRQFERANDFRNGRSQDSANAIKEAVNSVEAVLQVIYDRPGVSLTTILSEDLPADLPGSIKGLFRSLYSQGSGTVGARHASIGGNEPTGPRAELAIHVAAALHAFAIAELDT